jgi:RNA polymerase sigma-70 factor (ECF subfamily)
VPLAWSTALNAPLHLSARPDPFLSVGHDASVKSVDPRGLEQVYREHAARLWRALMAYTGDRGIADDALAEAFAQAVGRGEALRTPERWVWTAAFRIAAGELKTRGQRRTAPQPEPEADRSEAFELLEALKQLPPKQRAALVLHYYGGYRAREIALILGSTAATVRVHLSAGRRRLRALLEVDDG